MRNRLAFLAGCAALAARLYRALRRRGSRAPAPENTDPRADELRQRLAESRSVVAEREEFEAAEPPVDRAEPLADLGERRRQVHEAGRAAADRMRGDAQPD